MAMQSRPYSRSEWAPGEPGLGVPPQQCRRMHEQQQLVGGNVLRVQTHGCTYVPPWRLASLSTARGFFNVRLFLSVYPQGKVGKERKRNYSLGRNQSC